MIIFPNCKINLGLHITRKRSDGYHDLETIFYPLPLFDVLEIIKAEKDLPFTVTGIPIPASGSGNICLRAYNLLKKDFPQIPHFEWHLHKVIPTGAGLGGGSADGAFAIKLINTYCNLGLSVEKMGHYALQLGSDCPFFIINKPSFACGRGEFLETIPLDLSAYKFVIVHPGIHISTANAFQRIIPGEPGISLKQIISSPVDTWKQELKNDFEEPVFATHPEIKKIKEALYHAGAIYASLSGSGSAVYGIFKKEDNPGFTFPKDYFVKELSSQLQ